MIELSLLKQQLRITTNAQDELLQQMEEAAVSLVSRHNGRYYGHAEEVTEYVQGSDLAWLWLAEAPLTSDDLTVEVTERWDVADSGTVIDADADDGYTIRGRRLYRKNSSWPSDYEYMVTYTRGYAPGDEPAKVRMQVIQLVAHWYVNRIPTAEQTKAALSILGPPPPRV